MNTLNKRQAEFISDTAAEVRKQGERVKEKKDRLQQDMQQGARLTHHRFKI
ncbi:hypothetical protein [Pantoea anthophila]|uniref:hypothetical protein n=1 Tax=Pantoea anthophila TaxID=470931 RepID=UPI00301D9C90